MFKDIVQADILSIDFNEGKQQLIEHFQTRTSPKRPASVKSLVFFANVHVYTLIQKGSKPFPWFGSLEFERILRNSAAGSANLNWNLNAAT
jgi:hypothetical protein